MPASGVPSQAPAYGIPSSKAPAAAAPLTFPAATAGLDDEDTPPHAPVVPPLVAMSIA